MKYLYFACLLIMNSIIACDNLSSNSSQNVTINEINNEKYALYKIINDKASAAGDRDFLCEKEVRKFFSNWENWVKDNSSDYDLFITLLDVFDDQILEDICRDINFHSVSQYAEDIAYDLQKCLREGDLNQRLEAVFWRRTCEIELTMDEEGTYQLFYLFWLDYIENLKTQNSGGNNV